MERTRSGAEMILYPQISRMVGTILIRCLEKGYVASRGAGIFVTLDPHVSFPIFYFQFYLVVLRQNAILIKRQTIIVLLWWKTSKGTKFLQASLALLSKLVPACLDGKLSSFEHWDRRWEEKQNAAWLTSFVQRWFFFIFIFIFFPFPRICSIHCCFGKFCHTCNACTNAGWSCHGPINALCLGCMWRCNNMYVVIWDTANGNRRSFER